MALITSQQLKGNNANLTDNERKALEGEYATSLNNDFEPIRVTPATTYTLTRGLIAPKDFTNVDDIVTFQYNPEVVKDDKLVDYISRKSTGFSSVDWSYIGGGERTIDFELFLDATAGSNNKFGGKNVAYGNPSVDTLADSYPNGTLDMVEKITKFLYPIQQENVPRFSSGVAVPNIRFMPPPIAIFVYGRFYIQCVILSAPVEHILWDKDLIPRRSKVKVRLGVIETEVIKIDERLKQ